MSVRLYVEYPAPVWAMVLNNVCQRMSLPVTGPLLGTCMFEGGVYEVCPLPDGQGVKVVHDPAHHRRGWLEGQIRDHEGKARQFKNTDNANEVPLPAGTATGLQGAARQRSHLWQLLKDAAKVHADAVAEYESLPPRQEQMILWENGWDSGLIALIPPKTARILKKEEEKAQKQQKAGE